MRNIGYVISALLSVSCGNGAAVVFVGTDPDTVASTDTTTSGGTDTASDTGTSSDNDTASDTDTPSDSNTDTCALIAAQGFDESAVPAGWIIRGAARHEEDTDANSGWLELMAATPTINGSAFLTSHRLLAQDLHLMFSFYMGPTDMGGGDGLSLSIFNATDMSALFPLLDAATPGMTVGYGIADSWTGESFHVEFDTYYNQAQFGESHTDPADSDHVAVMRDADQTAHLLWTEIPNIEDSTWHVVEVQTTGEQVTVTLDGAVVIDDVIVGFSFSGGYVGFTASSGTSVNLHRIDDVSFYDMCFFEPFCPRGASFQSWERCTQQCG